MTRTLCASILVLFLAAACDRGEQPATKTPAAQAPATPPAPPPPAPQAATEPKPEEAPARTAGPFRIVGIDVGTTVGPDGRIATPADHLSGGDTIHAVLRTEGKPEAMTLTARLSYNRQTNLGTQEIPVTADPKAPIATKLTKADGFQKGEYRIEIWRGNDIQMVKNFVVD
jgi:hypothetical protein